MKIVVAIDGSQHAQRALTWALREADLRSASLTALHAFGVRRFAGPFNREVSLEPERVAAQELVDAALERAGADRVDQVAVDVTPIAVDVGPLMGNSAANAVLRHSTDADLIVIGSRGMGGFPGLLVGSVSQQVAAHAQVPVAVIPPGDDEVPPAPTSVVIGVDGSASSRRALAWAVEEAEVHDVPATAVYVHDTLIDTQLSAEFDAAERTQLSALEEHGREHALRLLGRIVDETLGTSHRAVSPRVVAGSAGRVLSQDAAAPTSILVVGSRGRGGFTGLLLGSVSQQCLHHAAGPVVVTPAA
jgi:nucleotide-binding universal stress UspA family protein